jgi:hypothetical protein
MGNTKTTTDTSSTTTPTPTPEMTAFNKLQLEQQQAIQPGAIQLQQNAYDLGSLLLQGQNLPGYLSGLPAGATAQQMPYQPDIPVETGMIGESQISDLVARSLRDIYPQFQAMGLPIESGVAQSIAGRTAGDIRTNTMQSNIANQLSIEEYNRAQRQSTNEYNINTSQATQYQNLNNLLNLINLAVGGQAQIQQPVISMGATLGQRLAGLSTINQTGTSTTTKNPFLESFYTSLGSTLGAPKVSAGPFSFGGS